VSLREVVSENAKTWAISSLLQPKRFDVFKEENIVFENKPETFNDFIISRA